MIPNPSEGLEILVPKTQVPAKWFLGVIAKIKGALMPFQRREIFTHVVYINMHLEEKPIYFSEFKENEDYHINAKLPDTVQLISDKNGIIKHEELLYHYCKDMIGEIENREIILNEIKEGKRRYVFNDKGLFIDQSIDLK